MHAIERPYLPRIGVLTLGAVLLEIVVLLLAASRVGDVGLSSGSASSGTATGLPATIHSAPMSSSFTNPFGVPFRVVLPWTAASRR